MKISKKILIALLLIAGTSVAVASTLPTTIPAIYETYLATQQSASDNTLTLSSATLKDGTSVTGFQCLTIDQNTPSLEYECGIVSGTTVTNVQRGIDFQVGTTTISTLAVPHRRGADVKITDYPILTFLTRILNGADTIPNVLSYATTTSTSTIAGANIPDAAYVLAQTALASSSAASTLLSGNNVWTGTNSYNLLTTFGGGVISQASSTFSSTINVPYSAASSSAVSIGYLLATSTANYVALTGNQTIAGNKTFTGTTALGLTTNTGTSTYSGASIVLGYDPANSLDAVTKHYNDTTDVLLAGTQTVTGAKTFSNTTALAATTNTGTSTYSGAGIVLANDPSNPLDAADKHYVDSVVSGGVSNANTTTKGIVQQATVAQVNDHTATGSTGAQLFMTPADLANSNFAVPSPVTYATSTAGSYIASGSVSMNAGDVIMIWATQNNFSNGTCGIGTNDVLEYRFTNFDASTTLDRSIQSVNARSCTISMIGSVAATTTSTLVVGFQTTTSFGGIPALMTELIQKH